jgi:hypothetical protein
MDGHLSLGEAKTLLQALESLGHGVLWLTHARDLIELAGANPQAAASVHALAHAGQGLMTELGGQLRALERSPEAEVQTWASSLLENLQAPEPSTPQAGGYDA